MKKCSIKYLLVLALFALVPCAFAAWQPGLIQAKIKGDPASNNKMPSKWYTDLLNTIDPENLDVTAGTLMVDQNFGGEGNKVVNTFMDSGKEWNWNNYSTFAYEGQIYLEGGVTYWFWQQCDDGAAIMIGGEEVVSAGTTSGYNNGFAKSYTPTRTGWHDLNIMAWEWTNGKGPNANCYGIAYSTTVTAAPTVKTLKVGTAGWNFLRDDGTGTFLRHDDGKGFGDELLISSEPAGVGVVSPAYGVTKLAEGTEVSCTATSPYEAADGSVWALSGYTLYSINTGTSEKTQIGQGTGATCAYTHGETSCELVWKWTLAQAEISVSNPHPALGTVSGGGMVAAGETVTLKATAHEGAIFVSWSGTLPPGVNASDPEITFVVDGSYSLTANFMGAYFVSDHGTEQEPYATWETAARSVETAVAYAQREAGTRATIAIDEGTYNLSDRTIQITNPLRILGKGDRETEKTVLVAAAGSRHFDVAHADAVLEGLTLVGGNCAEDASLGDGTAKEGVGSVVMSDGTITNCIFRNNRGNCKAGAVYMLKGTIANCFFHDNASTNDTAKAGTGGAIRMEDGLVSDSIISNNVASTDGNYTSLGAGIYMQTGTVQRCFITQNRNTRANKGCGGGIYMVNGLIDQCRVEGNSNVTRGGGIYEQSNDVSHKKTTIRNSLIVNNTASEGGGVWLVGGLLLHCTVWGNQSNGVGSGGYSSTLYNSIVYGNGAGIATKMDSNFGYNGSASACIISPATTNNQGGTTTNVDADPRFVDPENGDFHLANGSPAIDFGNAAYGYSCDFEGRARPNDGDGDGVAGYDVGCYEAPGPDEGALRCGFEATVTQGHDALETLLTARVMGAGKDGALTYEWTCPGGTIVETLGGGASVRVSYQAQGKFDVSLKVSSAGAEASFTENEYIWVGSSKVFVGAPLVESCWPYSSPDTAVPDIVEAVNSAVYLDGTRLDIEVDDGVWTLSTEPIRISHPTYLHSKNGRDKTIICGTPKALAKQSALNVSGGIGATVIEGFTIENFRYHNGHVVSLASGTIRDCTIRLIYAGSGGGGPLVLTNAKAENLLVTGCEAINGDNINGVGTGTVYLDGSASLIDSVVSNNFARVSAAGVYLKGSSSVVSNCVIVGNQSGYAPELFKLTNKGYEEKGAGSHGGVYIASSGKVYNSVIAGNYALKSVGGVYLGHKDAKLINCLVAENSAGVATHGISMANGNIESCTIAGNGVCPMGVTEYTGVTLGVVASTDTAGPAVNVTAGTILNTIVSDNRNSAANLAAGGATVTYSCAPELTSGEGNISASPCLRLGGGKNAYRLSGASPCINAAREESWMTGATDLGGNPRVLSKIPDIGCYECLRQGFNIILR